MGGRIDFRSDIVPVVDLDLVVEVKEEVVDSCVLGHFCHPTE